MFPFAVQTIPSRSLLEVGRVINCFLIQPKEIILRIPGEYPAGPIRVRIIFLCNYEIIFIEVIKIFVLIGIIRRKIDGSRSAMMVPVFCTLYSWSQRPFYRYTLYHPVFLRIHWSLFFLFHSMVLRLNGNMYRIYHQTTTSVSDQRNVFLQMPVLFFFHLTQQRKPGPDR